MTGFEAKNSRQMKDFAAMAFCVICSREDQMPGIDPEGEEEREKIRSRRFFIWAVVPSMFVLWGLTVWAALECFLGSNR